MTTSYLTRYTITDILIIVETIAGNERFIDAITRSVNENDAIKAVAVRHKEQADTALAFDPPQKIAARYHQDIKTGIRESNADSL